MPFQRKIAFHGALQRALALERCVRPVAVLKCFPFLQPILQDVSQRWIELFLVGSMGALVHPVAARSSGLYVSVGHVEIFEMPMVLDLVGRVREADFRMRSIQVMPEDVMKQIPRPLTRK